MRERETEREIDRDRELFINDIHDDGFKVAIGGFKLAPSLAFVKPSAIDRKPFERAAYEFSGAFITIAGNSALF